jgi:hypothetical protein
MTTSLVPVYRSDNPFAAHPDLTGYMDSNSGCAERVGSDIVKSRRGALPTHSLCCSFHLETERGATTDDVSPSLARANGCMYTQKRRRTVICLEVLVLRCYVTRRGVQFMHVEIACVSAFIDVWNSQGSTSARGCITCAGFLLIPGARLGTGLLMYLSRS